ncbi:ATP-binding protein [Cellulomonas sp.]|uniref:ATP-binding protein n=1 Tax=Cellulomonas sp. TaxID=40001 RepID=UPI003BA96733
MTAEPARFAAELRTALEALEAVVAVRLEERRAGPAGRLLGLDAVDEGIPDLARYRGQAPLARVIADAGLSAAEALVLVAAIAPHVDEKFDLRFAELTDRRDAVGLTGEVARTLVARTFAGRLDAAALLSSGAPLLASGLLTLDPPGDLSGRLRADPALVRWTLGLPPEPARASADFPARQLATVHTLEDVVLPGPARRRITDLADRIAHRDLVVDTWGFGRHHDNTSGLVALFHGPPGTGKTMTAAALSRSTGLPAYLVDLSALVSKYIGETEKALARVFDRAVREGCMLVFDEADAVFGRRTEVSDSHDRYANQEVSYLLSRIEAHPGVVVLTTNLLSNIDEAFQRRIHVMVEFPEPGPGERSRLWRSVLPRELPVARTVDLDALAQRYALSGAQIRDASLDAAYLAAADGRVVTQEYLVSGIHRQFEKAGRTVR